MAELLTVEEERSLITAAQNGDIGARNTLILKNQGLCRRAADRSPRPDWMDREDLILEGTLGLVKAIERFDGSKGCRFSTYASRWVGQAIQRCIEKNFHGLHIPSYAFHQAGSLERCRAMLLAALGREPTSEELSAESQIPRDQIEALQTACRRTASLDASIDDEEELSLIDILVDDYRFEDHIEVPIWVSQCLVLLAPRLREVLEQRFGLTGQPPLTFKEIAKTMRVSPERVRQWETQGLRMVRAMLEQASTGESNPTLGS